MDHYKTENTSLAAYLHYNGFHIIDIDHIPKRAVIYFRETIDEVMPHERNFYNGLAKVSPESYARIHKRLGKMMREKTPWTEGVLNG